MSGHQTRAAGWSATAKAQEVRAAGRGGLLRRVLRVLGLDPLAGRTEAAAGRWEAGAVGEEMTAQLLAPLERKGWVVFHDRALPTGRANVDHVLVPPEAGLLLLVDSKLWSKRRGPVNRSARGRLRHGVEDRQGAAQALAYERRVLEERLRVRVLAVMCVHSAPVTGGRFMLEGGIVVVQADGLVQLLGQYAGTYQQRRHARLVRAVEAALPRYGEREGL